MDISNIIVQGGLANREADNFQDQQETRAYTRAQRGLGVKQMDAAGKLIPGDTDEKLLKQQIEQNELEFQKATQPQEQAIKRSGVEHRAAVQPAAQRLARTGLEIEQGAADQAKALQPGAQTAATESQSMELQTLREKQAANLWGLYKTGDKQGTIDLLNTSQLLHPGRKFSDVQHGLVPAMGNDGKPLMGADGKPATEQVLKIVAADGGQDIYVPMRALEQNYVKQKSTPVKVGNNMVRQNPDGTVTPTYEPDQYGVNPETGGTFNKRTGLPPDAAAGVKPPAPTRKEVSHIDDRVKMGSTAVNKYFGINEFTQLDEKNQPLYNAINARMGTLVRQNADPEKAANQAILEGKDGRLNPDGSVKTAPAVAPAPAPSSTTGGGDLPRLW